MKKLGSAILLLTAGMASALALAGTAAASYGLGDLAGLGYTITADVNGSCTYYHASGNGAPDTNLGSDNVECTDPKVLQQNIDALVAAYPPPPPPAPATTAPAAPATSTTTASAPAPAPTAPATTTTDTVQAQIDNLQAQIDSLRTELVQLIKILEQWPGIDPGILSQLMALPQ